MSHMPIMDTLKMGDAHFVFGHMTGSQWTASDGVGTFKGLPINAGQSQLEPTTSDP